MPKLLCTHLDAKYEYRKLEPNLVSPEGKTLSAHNDENGVIVVGEGSQEKSFRAMVIPYHNSDKARRILGSDPNRKVRAVEKVSAQIAYKYFDNRNSLNIKRGAWLSEKESRVSFGVNDTRSLIIATIEGTPTNRPAVYAIQRDFDTEYKGSIARREELHGDLLAVTVRLIAEMESKEIGVYEYIMEIVREPQIEVTLHQKFFWQHSRKHDFMMEGYGFLKRLQNNENEEQMIEDVKDWEASAATFIGRHIGERQKTSFLSSSPSIEEGLQKASRFVPRLSRPDSPIQPLPRVAAIGGEFAHWTLYDSIRVRIDKLDTQ